MANGQLAHNLDYDYHSTTRSEGSSYVWLEDPWEEPIEPIFGTFTQHSGETGTTEFLRAHEDPWVDVKFELQAGSQQKLHRKWASTGATSPYQLFLSELETSSPFDTLLAFVRYGLKRENGERLAERLLELKFDLAEDEDAPNFSMASLLGLIRFLRDNPRLRDPGLVVSNTGNLRAEWHLSWKQHFVVEFMSTTEARFVVFVADEQAEKKVARISVRCSIDSLMNHATPHGVNAWAMRD